MTYKEFEEKWNAISTSHNGYLNIHIEHPLELKIGYYKIGYKGLIIMDTGEICDIPSTYAVNVKNIQLKNGQWALRFELLNNGYEEEFLHLCWDIIQYSQYSKTPLKNLIKRYLSWQKFLQYHKNNAFSIQRQKGLIGELLYLEEFINKNGEKEALRAWSGPDGSDQDFVYSNSWTEVKTVSLAAETVSISSLQQLDQNTEGNLVIYTLEKTAPCDDMINLAIKVEEIKDLIKNNNKALDIFSMKLYKYGYRESEIEEYKRNNYRYVEQKEYLVNKSFPKLTRNNVMPEIVSCKYSLSLSAIEKYRSDMNGCK